jgi:hypothetical protein
MEGTTAPPTAPAELDRSDAGERVAYRENDSGQFTTRQEAEADPAGTTRETLHFIPSIDELLRMAIEGLKQQQHGKERSRGGALALTNAEQALFWYGQP